MNKQEIEQALISQTPMVWNEPIPIEGNDYRITAIFELNEETAMILYGGGSQAEVYLHEIEIN